MSASSILKIIIGALLIAACACPRSHHRTQPQPEVTIFMAEEGTPGDSRCRGLDGDCLILREDPPPVRLTDYRATIEDGEKPAISLTLRAEDARELEALSQGALGGRLAVAVDGRIVHTPKVREPLKGNKLLLSYCGRERFVATRNALFPSDRDPRGSSTTPD
jgi:hypothetical protein